MLLCVLLLFLSTWINVRVIVFGGLTQYSLVDTHRRWRGINNLVTELTFSFETSVRTYQIIRRHKSQNDLYITAL